MRKNKAKMRQVEVPVEMELLTRSGSRGWLSGNGIHGNVVRQFECPSEIYAMLGCYAKWLNQVHADLGEGDDMMVTVEEFWLEDDEGTLVNGPLVWLDSRCGAMERRVIGLLCTPFHDEGGPAKLYGVFEFVDGLETRLKKGREDRPGERDSWETVQGSPADWRLDSMTAEFDTYTDLIVAEGNVLRKDMT